MMVEGENGDEEGIGRFDLFYGTRIQEKVQKKANMNGIDRALFA